MPSALVLIANGTEEMEFTIPFDTLVRAGVECTSAMVYAPSETPSSPPIAVCSRGVKIVADTTFNELQNRCDFDCLIIPGGLKGAETLSKDSEVQNLIRSYFDRDVLVGMICAGSLAAKTAGLPHQPLTSHPSVKTDLEKSFDYKEESVVVSGKLVTSRGPGTTFPFAFKLVELLCGEEKAAATRTPMVFPQ